MRSVLASLLLIAACSSDDAGDPQPDAGPGTRPITVEPAWSDAAAFVLASDSSHLFVGSTTLSRIPLAAGAAETLYTVPASLQFATISQIWTFPEHVLFVQSSIEDTTTTRTLYRIAPAGGEATKLASSTDSRSFLGATIDGSDALFSIFTLIYRVPLAGGTVRAVAESPESVRYWIYSPTIVGDNLIWYEGGSLFTIPKSQTGEGERLAAMPGTGRIIRDEPSALVVALTTGFGTGANAYAEVDPQTGALFSAAPIAFGREVTTVSATSSDVWAESWDGLVRVPRATGVPELVPGTEELVRPGFGTTAATSDAVFIATDAGIARVAL